MFPIYTNNKSILEPPQFVCDLLSYQSLHDKWMIGSWYIEGFCEKHSYNNGNLFFLVATRLALCSDHFNYRFSRKLFW